jgi:hypothetical protein
LLAKELRLLAKELHKKTAPGAALSDFQELHLDT